MSYLNQRYASSLMRIRREVRLPDNAVGSVRVVEGQAVDIRNKVARGIVPTHHYIIEAAKELGLRDPASLKNLLLVTDKRQIEAGTVIAGKDALRGKRVFAPANGVIAYVGEGRIIFQELPKILDLEAGVRGTVTQVIDGRSVIIEATGAWLQGVWGNGGNVIATMRLEPSRGIETIQREALDLTYKNEIVVTARPLTLAALEVAEVRRFAGIVAPSMPIELLPMVQDTDRAIFLTEGFGNYRMSVPTFELLKEFDSYQVTLDAHLPRRWDVRRPELVINRTINDMVPAPDPYLTLKKGQRVRITREPHVGNIARVLNLPKNPMPLENGLLVPCARVEIATTGNQINVPLANLEYIG